MLPWVFPFQGSPEKTLTGPSPGLLSRAFRTRPQAAEHADAPEYRSVLTWLKLPTAASRLHKVREEYEVETRDRRVLSSIVETMGFKLAWRYEKYRTEFRRPREKGKILLDETPVGDLLELEGSADWIDRTAIKLGFSKDDYITLSYRSLFVEYHREHPEIGEDMLF